MFAKNDFGRRMDRNGSGPAVHAGPDLLWDETLGQLRLAGRVIKQFRQPAPIQEMVLGLFQTSGWASYMRSPLPTDSCRDPGARLRELVRNLNRAQRRPGLRFHVHRGSTIIYWTLDDETNNITKKLGGLRSKNKKNGNFFALNSGDKTSKT
jgi:hypothetical protein